MKQTQLYDWHVSHGARMAPFAGWEMPIQYPTGPIAEHHLTRRSIGVFDIDHMGQISVTGPDAVAYLNYLVTWDVATIAPGRSHYALMCKEDGGILDDVFVYHLSDRWLVVVNAANLEKDYQWMQDQMADYDVTVTDVSDETYMVAVQGPNAIALMDKLLPVDVPAMARFGAVETALGEVPMVVGRTGYTGEDGVEIYFPAQAALPVWETLLKPDHGFEVGPVGLAARDSLRFEPGFALYGHEIDMHITPLEAGLQWACRFETGFIGSEALVHQQHESATKKLVAFELTERGVPRQDYPVLKNGREVGIVVTGMYAPTVHKYCGHAFVPADHATVGTTLHVVIRSQPKAAVVVKRPFYKPAYR